MASRVPPPGAHYSRQVLPQTRPVQHQAAVPVHGARIPVATPNAQVTVAATTRVGQTAITYSGHVVPGQR